MHVLHSVGDLLQYGVRGVQACVLQCGGNIAWGAQDRHAKHLPCRENTFNIVHLQSRHKRHLRDCIVGRDKDIPQRCGPILQCVRASAIYKLEHCLGRPLARSQVERP